ncbi:MAG: glycosyltransferase involved in cell wall biosynthesis [Sphingobacteriales bacterium]|jgi:glycosyltransferase involved in cell wall biosynthesis
MSAIKVIIPAYNEQASIKKVLDDIPRELVDEIIVINNASTDNTAEVAKTSGATVLFESVKGYGSACQKGLTYLSTLTEKPDIVVFLDADYSDHPEEIEKLIKPILEEEVMMVIGSRATGKMEKGAMMPQQIFGNWLATSLIKLFYGYTFTDLGPFRAIRYDALLKIDMQDTSFGWTVEMQVKAAKMKMKCREVPVTYRKRIGVSKITGTVKGTIKAGYMIIYTIFKYL